MIIIPLLPTLATMLAKCWGKYPRVIFSSCSYLKMALFQFGCVLKNMLTGFKERLAKNQPNAP